MKDKQIDLPFDGETYSHIRDYPRLSRQLEVVLNLMIDSQWRTLSKIHIQTGEPEASISARLRDLRKIKNGGYIIERRYIGNGLHEYQLRIPGIMYRVK